MQVYCDMENDGGGWTDFLLGWQQYAAGFGNLKGKFWLGDGMASNNGRRFSTVDQDKDHSSGDCASHCKGAWWHGACTNANLNGLYLRGSYSGVYRGVFWVHWRGQGYSLKHTEMKMRRL
ncbi:hypothetical protein CAPTEDRAFT_188670 [Capitella teleta]|uniref:Fibrinogen C-terminal domain-containing protein n=1 Tax=Capitella teleta TaxID=283909 RepID=R7UAC8_CAPTE|nr:hypothetical protein CAPTEDRAFT_188670 [Capitella teleta]|eukprot:ELU00096.1 hypothetical protein CAPTEDRAFT_188670 [Capitella teleta]